MPELPEVETARRGMETALLGKRLKSVKVSRYDLRIPIPEDIVQNLTGKTCYALKRRGKYIILLFDNNIAAILHLGMSGRIRIYPPAQKIESQKHDHVILTLDDESKIIFNDPRRFGMFYTIPSDQLELQTPFCNMGPEPLEDWSAESLLSALAGRKSPIKSALLDQTIVSGLGNIYVCEALFCAGICPLRPAYTLKFAECERFISCTQEILRKAIAAGGSTLRDHKQTDGSLGYFQYHFAVYDRENTACPRPKCNGIITRIVQSGRSTFSCGTCQK